MKLPHRSASLLVVVFLLVQSRTAQAAPADGLAESPEIRLVPSCRDCVSIEEVDLALGITCPDESPMEVTSSRLILMDEHGEILASIVDPYRHDGETIGKGLFTSGVTGADLGEILSGLTADSYNAVLQINDLYSNVVTFHVGPDLQEPPHPGPGCQGSLQIEPLVDMEGRESANAFMAYFRNRSEKSVILPALWADSRLLASGKEYQLRGFIWIGMGNLWPGRSWGKIVALDLFFNEQKEKISPGTHSVQYLFGGCMSNEITIKVEE